MSAFIQLGNLIPGVVGQGDVNSDYKVHDIRASLYKQMPSEYMERYPLTKMVLGRRGKIAQVPKIEWGMEALNDRVGDIAACYSDVGLTTMPNAGLAAGSTVYLKLAGSDAPACLAQAHKFRPYEEIELRHCSTSGVQGTLMLDVVLVEEAGTASYLKCTTLETDSDNVLRNTSLLKASITSMAVPEGSGLPGGKYTEPTMHFNYSQIIMAALSVTGSELADISVFDESTYERYLRQTHDDFNAQVERALKLGVRMATTASVNVDGYAQTVKRYKMGGLRWMHKSLGGNYLRIPEVTTFGGETFTGKTWAQVGYPFLKTLLYTLGKYAGSRKILLASSKVMQDISDMLESMTAVTIGPTFKNAWGFEVNEVRGLNCRLQLQQDADLSLNSAWEDMVYIVEPDKFQMRPRKGRDMTLIRSSADLKKAMQIENGFTWRDALKEGIVADFSFTVDDLDGMAVIEGWGRDFASA